jgi:hypothetical protein
VLYLGKLQPYPQTLDQAGEACHGQTLYPITKSVNYNRKKFYSASPWSKIRGQGLSLPKREALTRGSTWVGFVLTHKFETRLKRFGSNRRSSLFVLSSPIVRKDYLSQLHQVYY